MRLANASFRFVGFARSRNYVEIITLRLDAGDMLLQSICNRIFVNHTRTPEG
jgi:hypothetical protein